MEHAAWATALVLLSLATPFAAAEDDPAREAVEELRACVDLEGPTVQTHDCGPTVGVDVLVETPVGSRHTRVGCESDCDHEVRVCALVKVSSPVDVRTGPQPDAPPEPRPRAVHAVDGEGAPFGPGGDAPCAEALGPG